MAGKWLHAAFVRCGMRVRVDPGDGAERDGTVTSVRECADAYGNPSVELLVTLDDCDSGGRPGLHTAHLPADGAVLVDVPGGVQGEAEDL